MAAPHGTSRRRLLTVLGSTGFTTATAGCGGLFRRRDRTDTDTPTRNQVSDRLQEVVTNGWIDPLTNRIYVIGITVAKAPGGRPIDLSDVVLVCTIETDLGEYTGTYRYGGTVGEPKDIGGSAVPPVGATTNTFRASVVEDNDDSSERRHVVDDREDRYKLVFALGAGGAPQLEGGEKGTVKIYNGPAVSTIRFTVPKNLQKKRRVGL